MRRLFTFIVAATAITDAAAQVKCTMPNGVTITKQLGGCPHDATAAFKLDGTPLPKPSETKEGQRALEQIQKQRQEQESIEQKRIAAAHEAKLKEWQKESAAKKAQELRLKDEYRARLYSQSCSTLGLPAHRCDVETSIFKGNFVILKTHLIEYDIDTSCKQAAGHLRKELLDGRGSGGWQIRIIYSPTGATISECQI